MTWDCHVDYSAKGRYDILLGRYILTALGLNLKIYYHVIEANGGPFKSPAASMVDLGAYEFKF